MEVPIRASRLTAILNILNSDGKTIAWSSEPPPIGSMPVSRLLLTLLADSATVTGITVSNGELKLTLSARVTGVELDEKQEPDDLGSAPANGADVGRQDGPDPSSARIVPPDGPSREPRTAEASPNVELDTVGTGLGSRELASRIEVFEDIGSSSSGSGMKPAAETDPRVSQVIAARRFEQIGQMEDLDDPTEIARETEAAAVPIPAERQPAKSIVLEDLD
jgi:hypothetical protein